MAWPLQLRQACHESHRFQTDGDYFADEAEDILVVVGAVGFAYDVAGTVGLGAVQGDDPFGDEAIVLSILALLIYDYIVICMRGTEGGRNFGQTQLIIGQRKASFI